MSDVLDDLIDHISLEVNIQMPSAKPPPWSAAEDAFLRQNLGWLTDDEIGAALGRSGQAVLIHRARELHLAAPSKAPDVITAHRASIALGVDVHAVCGWMDAGLMPYRLLPGGKTRLIQRVTFLRWAISPENWIYFDIERVREPHLKRLIDLRARRWGDEWWSTRRVGDYHGVDAKTVMIHIKRGVVRGTQARYSINGRHPERAWANWFVLRSEATRPDLVFYTRGNTKHKRFSARAEAFIVRARDVLKLQWDEIARMMKLDMKKPSSLLIHYKRAKQDGKCDLRKLD